MANRSAVIVEVELPGVLTTVRDARGVECDDAAARERSMVAATDYGPFERPVDELTVITGDDEGRWTTRWRLPLG